LLGGRVYIYPSSVAGAGPFGPFGFRGHCGRRRFHCREGKEDKKEEEN